MSKRDYYDILGVNKAASSADIKKAYHKLAMSYHPDRNPGDKGAEEKFKEISQAYDILSTPDKRAAYDRYGHSAFDPSAGGGAQGHGGGFGGFGGSGFSDIFEEVFGDFMGGGGARRRGSSGPSTGQKGSDLRYDCQITLEDAFKGIQRKVKIKTMVRCTPCSGSGATKDTVTSTCVHCKGHGAVRFQQGFFTVEQPCNACHGTGKTVKNPCKSCQGQGRVAQDKTIHISIPAGIEDGVRIRLSGEGEAGLQNGGAGDLYVFVTIKKHSFFSRDTSHLFCQVPIPMTTAALGGTIEVATIDGGRARVTIPKGTQHGSHFRLKGKGMPILRRHQFGDMIIEAAIETPVKLSSRQEEILNEFAKLQEKEKNSPASDKFFSKLRDFWEDLTNTN